MADLPNKDDQYIRLMTEYKRIRMDRKFKDEANRLLDKAFELRENGLVSDDAIEAMNH